MNNSWETAINFVLKMEGGEIAENDPNDPGGLTKYGISQKAYPNLDIANLTLDQAKEIYRKDYWEACRCDELAFPFDVCVFDTAVNQGVGKAKRLLQMSLGVLVDGVIGETTISATHKASPRLAKRFLAQRLAEYTRLISANQSLMVYAVNWSFRVISLAELILGKTTADESGN